MSSSIISSSSPQKSLHALPVLRTLCIGDVHIQINNLTAFDILFQKLEEYLLNHSHLIDIIIVMGDVLHTHERLHTLCFNYATKFFDLLRKYKETYVLVGNHDFINNSQFLSKNHWMNCYSDYKNLFIIDNVTHKKINGVDILLCPYMPDGRFIEGLNTFKTQDWKEVHCIFGHQLINGAKMGAIIAENGDSWKKEYPLLISGHIHEKQKLHDNMYYTGSCMQHCFGDTDDKCLVLVELNDPKDKKDNFKLTDIFISGLPKKRIIYLDMNDIDDKSKFDEKKLKLESAVDYKLTLSGSLEDFNSFKKSQRYKDLCKMKIKVIFKHKKREIEESSCKYFHQKEI